MPQIKVNEIDQSVVTRVVSDDKVKVFCPIIASFGPGVDGTENSVRTFTDVTDFNRAFGYTEAEFNPLENDYSRIYARELIKKGAAVSVVKINNGGGASKFVLDAGSTTGRRTTPLTMNDVCPASLKADSSLVNSTAYQTYEISSEITVSGTTFSTGKTNIVPGTVALVIKTYTSGGTVQDTYNLKDTLQDGSLYGLPSGTTAKINYSSGEVTITPALTPPSSGSIKASGKFDYIDTTNSTFNIAKYCFAPQIAGIEAKYTGSFGNDIVVTISQINTTRLAESFQYASVTVYYIDRSAEYDYDAETQTAILKNQSVQSVRVLETKRISTNPNDPNYFEDVEFEFIKILTASNAREELALVWSNIDADPLSSNLYSGFPVVPLKYKPKNSIVSVYNTNAYMNGGSDFPYKPETLAKLMAGFKGYIPGDTWTNADVNAYMQEVYGSGGIIENINATLSSDIYSQFEDPYIYDFDFITASGIVFREYDVDYPTVSIVEKEVTISSANYAVTLSHPVQPGSLLFVGKQNGTDISWKDVKTGDDAGKIVDTTTGNDVSGASIVYSTGAFVVPGTDTPTYADTKVTYTYYDQSKTKVATQKTPEAVTHPDGGNYCFYTEVTPIHRAMRELVDTRQDCIALFDVPHDYDPMMIVDYSLALNTSYGTMHHPWCWVNSPDIVGKQILMAPSYIFLYTFLSNLIDNVESQKWFPPAGVSRATARVVQRPDYEIGSVLLNEWQNDNISRVNPIMKLKQYGYVIYGQYTTLPAIDMYTHSALESLNVRLISNVVKKKIFDACLNLAFDPNTEKLWLKFFAQMDTFLRFMKYNQGVYDYRIVMDESTVTTDDINHLRCPGKVYIAPTRTAEFFDIDFIITDAGAVFND